MSDTTKDYLVRGTAWGGKIRVFAARTTELTRELQRRHGTLPTASAALGRTAAIGAMMGIMLKGEEKLTLQVKGDGPIGAIVVDANARGEVRGYVDNPQAHLPPNAQGKLDVAGVVGTTGYVHVTKDLGLKEPYRGSVPIISGSSARISPITSPPRSRRPRRSASACSWTWTAACCMPAASSSSCCRASATRRSPVSSMRSAICRM